MTGLSLRAAEIEHDRRDSDVDEDEAAEFWEAHEEWIRGYYEARRDDRPKQNPAA